MLEFPVLAPPAIVADVYKAVRAERGVPPPGELLCMCVCACMYVYVYMCVCVYMGVCVHVYMCAPLFGILTYCINPQTTL
jgi:hypothetical protein